jgi:hypothetical protein
MEKPSKESEQLVQRSARALKKESLKCMIGGQWAVAMSTGGAMGQKHVRLSRSL